MERTTIFNKNIGIIIKIVITILLVSLILLKVDITKVVSSLLNIKARNLILPILLATIIIFLKIYRWYYLIKSEGSINFRDAFVSYMAGSTIAIITPLRVGELARVLYIKHKSKVKLIKYCIIDKAFDLVVTIFFFVLALSCIKRKFLPLVFILILTPLLLMYIRKMKIFIKNIFPLKDKVIKVMNLLDSFRLIDKKKIVTCLLLTSTSFVISTIQFYALILSFETVSFVAVFFVFPLILLSNLLPVTIGGVGIREGASIFLFSFFGVSKVSALNATFLIFVLNFLIPSIIGLFFVNKKNL